MGEGGPESGSDDCDGEAFLRRFGLFLLSPPGGSRNKKTASRLQALLRQWGDRKVCSRKDLESLVGMLNHSCKVVRAGKTGPRNGPPQIPGCATSA